MKTLSTIIAFIVVLSSCGIKRAATHGPVKTRFVPQTVYSFKTDSTGKIISKEKKVVYVPETRIIRTERSSTPDVNLIDGGAHSSARIDSMDRASRSKPENNPNYHYSGRSEGQYP
ncbi:MAG: hypothetical protein K0S09_3205 [Sphingobacteriaceae bacterium]|nr:hypothetical protein [Sphingobacteriaceae bacterium]